MSVADAFHQCLQSQGLQNVAPSFVVAISGGADSLCLALIANEWVKKNGGSVRSVTVDHGLRKDSSLEAAQVAKWMQLEGIQHSILRWEGEKTHAGIQMNARNARYNLLIDACLKSVDILLLGHHRGDQRETFLMRLVSGSGPDGLAGMAERTVRGGVTLLRPFLNLEARELKEELEHRGQSWIEDPSNKNSNFTRVRFRQYLKSEGLTERSLDGLIKRFQKDRDYWQTELQSWCEEHVEGQPPLYCHIKSLASFQRLHPALGQRVLRCLIQRITCAEYPLGDRQLTQMWNRLQQTSFTAMTIGGCYVLKRKGGIHIQREQRAIRNHFINGLWDGRIDVKTELNHEGCIIRPLGTEKIAELKTYVKSSIPTVVWPTLPTVWKNHKLLGVMSF